MYARAHALLSRLHHQSPSHREGRWSQNEDVASRSCLLPAHSVHQHPVVVQPTVRGWHCRLLGMDYRCFFFSIPNVASEDRALTTGLRSPTSSPMLARTQEIASLIFSPQDASAQVGDQTSSMFDQFLGEFETYLEVGIERASHSMHREFHPIHLKIRGVVSRDGTTVRTNQRLLAQFQQSILEFVQTPCCLLPI